YLAIKRDRSEALLARRASEARESELEGLLDRIPLGIVMHADGIVRYANQTLLALVGRADVVGRALFGFIHPDDRDRFRQRLETAAQTRVVPEPAEIRLLRGDGGTVCARVQPVGLLRYRGDLCFCAA